MSAAGAVNPRVEQLLMLKAVTLRLGVLHEAQALQLKMWPLAALPFITKSVAKVDVESRTVSFDCEAPSVRKTKKLTQGCTALESWVRFLLWDDSVVFVRINGKQVHPSV
jgi:hypothetical protein